MPSTPVAPPRAKRANGTTARPEISPPTNFVHIAHVGNDFNPEDVKRAIRPPAFDVVTDRKVSLDNRYESTSHLYHNQETPILQSTSPLQTYIEPPEMDAPLYETASSVVHYENFASSHDYENFTPSTKPRPSRKKNPPPPPPPINQKPRIVTEESVDVAADNEVLFRKPSPRPSEPIFIAPPPPIDTPQRIECNPVSMILERPDMLGEMRIGLDDPVPIQSGPSSKYRTPSMLTPSPSNRGDSSSSPTQATVSPTSVNEVPPARVEPATLPSRKTNPSNRVPQEMRNVIDELKTQVSLKKEMSENSNDVSSAKAAESNGQKDEIKNREIVDAVIETLSASSMAAPQPVPKPRKRISAPSTPTTPSQIPTNQGATDVSRGSRLTIVVEERESAVIDSISPSLEVKCEKPRAYDHAEQANDQRSRSGSSTSNEEEIIRF